VSAAWAARGGVCDPALPLRAPAPRLRLVAGTGVASGRGVPGGAGVANHESPRTTKLDDRTSDAISLDEIERILI
jgi:hypothetical protein